MSETNKDIARYILNRAMYRGKLRAKQKGQGCPRFEVIAKIVAKERKKEKAVRLGRKLAVILPESDRVNEFYNDWMALGKTKPAFAEYVRKRLLRDGCT